MSVNEQKALPPGDPPAKPVEESIDWMTPVERWRFRSFLQAGFEPTSSVRLAISRADVHEVVRQLARGCSLELAIEIFI